MPISEKAHKADQNEGTNIDDDPGLIGGGMAPMRPYSQSRWRRGWLGSSISPVTPPQRTYRMAIMPIPPASHRWWLCDEWVNPRKEWAQRDHLDGDPSDPFLAETREASQGLRRGRHL